MRLAAVALVLLGGCSAAVSSRAVRGPDGETNWIAITCKGAQMRCVERAGEACPRGYVTASERGHDGQRTVVVANAQTLSAASAPVYEGELLVKCHGAPVWWQVDPTRFRTCFHAEACDAGDTCSYAADATSDDGKYGRCRPPTQ